MNGDALLTFEGIGKSFAGVRVLHGVSFGVGRGRTVGLVGENGAGKSTLMNILGGNLRADTGRMRLDGRAYEPAGPAAAARRGIAFVHQELNLFPNLTIAENLFLTRFPLLGAAASAGTDCQQAGQQTPSRRGWLPIIDRGRVRQRAATLLREVGLDLSPDTRIERLSAGERQLVEIAKALSLDARLIILDEPTTSLSARESEKLFALLGQLRARGIAMIYISHNLGEVLRLCDDLVVLRDGAVVAQGPRAGFDADRMIALMVGRSLNQLYPSRAAKFHESDERGETHAEARHPLTPSLSHSGGEGARRAGEGEAPRSMAREDVPQDEAASHERERAPGSRITGYHGQDQEAMVASQDRSPSDRPLPGSLSPQRGEGRGEGCDQPRHSPGEAAHDSSPRPSPRSRRRGSAGGTRRWIERLAAFLRSGPIRRELPDVSPSEPSDRPAGETPAARLLEVRGLTQPGIVKDIQFTLHRGELLGIFGLMGAGRSELARILFGLDPCEIGEVRVNGAPISRETLRRRIQRGLAFLTEDRRAEGLCLEASIADNIALVSLRQHSGSPTGLLNLRALAGAVSTIREAVRLTPTARDEAPVKTLSGGNQQKVVLAKWLLAKPSVLILDEPTRGIDVGARFEIYQLILNLADRGAGVLLISSELEELIGLCDRILVMRRGEMVDELDRTEFDRERILKGALGA